MSQDQKIRVLTSAEIQQLLPMQICIELMAKTLTDLTRGDLHQPLRTVIRPDNSEGLMALMPAYRPGPQSCFGLKAICVFPRNTAIGKDAHQGAVMLFSGETGELRALLNASAITAIRTAAVSAVATRLLAREDACELTIIGSGVQARTHLEAIACVRPLKRVRVVGRITAHTRQFTSQMAAGFQFPVETFTDVKTALAGADIVVTCTSAQEPVLKREWLAAGTHINAIGTSSPRSREIDGATMATARLFVDRRESALNEAGDYLLAAAEGLVSPTSIVAEIGELLTGEKSGRNSPNEITLFKSLGLAVEDLACAEYLFRKAQSEAVGTSVSF